MRLPISQLVLHREVDGKVHLEKIGWSPFIEIGGIGPLERGQILQLHGDSWRVLQYPVASRSTYCDRALAMKDGVTARLLQSWYQAVDWLLPKTSKIEWQLGLVQEGEIFPWWTVSRWLASTYYRRY